MEGITFSLPNPSDITIWRAHLQGPPNTPYAKGTFQVQITFPPQYPFKPPTIVFLTKVYHPNVKADSGEICSAIFHDSWGPTLNVKHCMNVIRNIMENPDADNFLEEEIAMVMIHKPKEYEKTALKYTKDYAM